MSYIHTMLIYTRNTFEFFFATKYNKSQRAQLMNYNLIEKLRERLTNESIDIEDPDYSDLSGNVYRHITTEYM